MYWNDQTFTTFCFNILLLVLSIQTISKQLDKKSLNILVFGLTDCTDFQLDVYSGTGRKVCWWWVGCGW